MHKESSCKMYCNTERLNVSLNESTGHVFRLTTVVFIIIHRWQLVFQFQSLSIDVALGLWSAVRLLLVCWCKKKSKPWSDKNYRKLVFIAGGTLSNRN